MSDQSYIGRDQRIALMELQCTECTVRQTCNGHLLMADFKNMSTLKPWQCNNFYPCNKDWFNDENPQSTCPFISIDSATVSLFVWLVNMSTAAIKVGSATML